MMTKHRVFITTIAVFFIIVIGMLVQFLFFPVVRNSTGIIYTINEGESFQTVVADLHKQNIIPHPYFFMFLAHMKGDLHHLKTGEYFFPDGVSALKLLNQITTGTGLYQRPFIIIAGWNFKQIRDALNRAEKLQHTTQALTDKQIMTALGYPDLNPEGEFYPNTYYYTAGYIDLKLLKRSFNAMQVKLTKAWTERSPTLPYTTMYQALIAASLIEKEAHFDIERPVISGVLINRLHKNMLLQIDATVIYGMGANYTGTIYKKDLLKNTPYNTYAHKGFPPTPIAVPGLSSINAAMHPEDNDYIYYVARGDGYHHFSKTWREHLKAIDAAKKYRAPFNSAQVKRFIIAALLPERFLRLGEGGRRPDEFITLNVLKRRT